SCFSGPAHRRKATRPERLSYLAAPLALARSRPAPESGATLSERIDANCPRLYPKAQTIVCLEEPKPAPFPRGVNNSLTIATLAPGPRHFQGYSRTMLNPSCPPKEQDRRGFPDWLAEHRRSESAGNGSVMHEGIADPVPSLRTRTCEPSTG